MKPFNTAIALLFVALALARGGDWREQVDRSPPGGFAPLPDVEMHFAFGWSNVLEAGQATAEIRRDSADYRAEVTGGTLGLARLLWPLDATYTGKINATTMLPISSLQIERYRNRTIETEVRHDATGLERQRRVEPSTKEAKWKRVNFEPLHGILSGVLYVRSQPLRVGDTIALVCFPGDSPYLANVRVEARETIASMGGQRPALRLSLRIQKLEVRKKVPTQAVDYDKFESGTIWVSDDVLRLPLRAEINVMVGFVYGELTGYRKL